MYHMKPATPAAGEAAGRGRGGAGFSSSEVTPLVIDGTMYIATPYYRVVAVDATTGKELWSLSPAVRQSVDPRRRVLARRRADAAADRLRLE